MKTAMEKLWNDYFSEECGAIHTQEEKALIKKVDFMRQTATESLTHEQSEVMDKYVETLYEMQSIFLKKAFFYGCEFTMSFLLEIESLWKR